MIVIQETRCDPEKLRKTSSLLGFDGFLATDVHGYAGGIMVGWKDVNMKIQLISRNFQYMHLEITAQTGKQWFFSPIYASPIEENRKNLWNDLKHYANQMHEAWMLAGDFNDITCSSEKKGGVVASTRRCNTFVERINSCKLLDLGCVGTKFIWRGPLYHGGQIIF
jgi:exonuclease III